MPPLVFYLLGFVVLIAGLAMGASMLGVSQNWILVGIIILVGIMLLSLSGNMRNGRR